jgi:hypothetical protein
MKFFNKKFLLSLLLAMSFSPKVKAFENNPKKEEFVNQMINKRLNKMRKAPTKKEVILEISKAKNPKFLSMQLHNPSWVTGFVDGEGCFSVSFNKREKLARGIEVRPSFGIGQKEASLESLQNVQNFFGCGSIRYSNRDGCYKYEVRSLNDITEKIIPHFDKYPLKTQKKKDFEIFTIICKDMLQSKHLSVLGIKQIIKNAYTMNPAGTRKYSYEELIQSVKD